MLSDRDHSLELQGVCCRTSPDASGTVNGGRCGISRKQHHMSVTKKEAVLAPATTADRAALHVHGCEDCVFLTTPHATSSLLLSHSRLHRTCKIHEVETSLHRNMSRPTRLHGTRAGQKMALGTPITRCWTTNNARGHGDRRVVVLAQARGKAWRLLKAG